MRESTVGNDLASALRYCGLKRMADVAERGGYIDNKHQLVMDIRYALTLKLTLSEVSQIGKLHARIIKGEFDQQEKAR